MTKIFILPPPNVTGNLHIGHALNITIQDIQARWMKAKGEEVVWIPGTDHAGIATQLIAERALKAEGKTKNDLSSEEFIKHIWSIKEKFEPNIIEQIKSMNTVIDWDRYCFTLDDARNEAVNTAFKMLYDRGLIFRQERFVYWDTLLQTACSDLEVDFKTVKGNFYYINYPIVDEDDQIVDHICVATTRPETLFGDIALCIHPDNQNNKKYLGKYALVPIIGRKIPIIADEACDIEKGTGVLKITPAHDILDYEIGKRHDLEAISVIDKAGLLCNVPAEFIGLTVQEGKKKVAQVLEELGYLVKIESLEHNVPHGEKSGSQLEFMSTLQWFVDAKPLAEKALKVVKAGLVEFIPERFTHIYNQWLENIEPWCISRQIAWGHRLPVWYDADEKVYVGTAAEVEQQVGTEKFATLKQDKDVLDTWFSSALWPFATQGWPNNTDAKNMLDMNMIDMILPTAFLVTGKDILFFWVARMIMMSVELCNKVPFKQVYLHGLVLDKHGKKMSKVVGNVIDPLELIEKYNADVLRMALIKKAFPGKDVRFEDSELDLARNFLTKLRNALDFCKKRGANNNTNNNKAIELESLVKTNQIWSAWILDRCHQVYQTFDALIEKWEFAQAYQMLEKFTRDEFCGWYLEVTKTLDEEHINEVLGYVTKYILHMLHIFAPGFATEHDFVASDMLLSAKTKQCQTDQLKHIAVEQMQSYIEKARSILKMPDSPFKKEMLVAEEDLFFSANSTKEIDMKTLELMSRLAKAKFSVLSDENKNKYVQYVFEGGRLFLELNTDTNLSVLQARLTKEIAEHDNIISQANARLNNKQFIDNAAAELVDEMKERIEIQTKLKVEKESVLFSLKN